MVFFFLIERVKKKKYYVTTFDLIIVLGTFELKAVRTEISVMFTRNLNTGPILFVSPSYPLNTNRRLKTTKYISIICLAYSEGDNLVYHNIIMY